MGKTRIILDEKDFRNLSNGGIVKKGDVEIALSDIGFKVIFSILSETYKKMIKKL